MKRYFGLITLVLVLTISGFGQTLQYAGSYPTQYSKFVHVENNLALVIDSLNLLILNATDPTAPSLLGTISIPGHPERLDVRGNYAYVAAGDSGLKVVDISTPSNPTIAASFATTNYATDAIVTDTLCYLLCAHRFVVVDIANLSNLHELSNLYLYSFWNSSMEKKGNDIYYFADYGEFSFIAAINVANPANPLLVANEGTGFCVRDISINRNTLLAVSDCFNSLYRYDISIPDTIRDYHYYSWDALTSVATGFGYAFITAQQGVVRIVDYSNPDSIALVSSYDTPGRSSCVRVSGHYLYVADSSSLQILNFSNLGHCHYVVGDINYSGSFNGVDVIFALSYYMGRNFPAYLCECTANNWWYVAGDLNGSCSFNGVDVTFMVNYFKGGPAPHPCASCPPTP